MTSAFERLRLQQQAAFGRDERGRLTQSTAQTAPRRRGSSFRAARPGTSPRSAQGSTTPSPASREPRFARLSSLAADVGVATEAAYRGRGLARAAVAGWAGLPDLAGRSLFYGVSANNAASRAVASRLGLPFLGATFTLD